jgi:hypothetical protein
MRQTKCEVIRCELEELMLGDECSTNAAQHLRECAECQEFHQKQTRLRQIVGSLGTIEAPADFDFRLRARLANEPSAAGFHLRATEWSFVTRGLAAAAVLLLFVGGMVLVRNTMNRQSEVVARKDEPAPQPAKTVETPANKIDQGSPVAPVTSGPRRVRNERVATKPKRSVVAVDFSNERAEVISDSQRQSTIFPIDTAQQPLRVSLDDGRGNARTISVPTISFGSQRVLPNGNQFAPKRVW